MRVKREQVKVFDLTIKARHVNMKNRQLFGDQSCK